MHAEFRVLGPLEVRVDGREVRVPAGRTRVLLATLLLHANRFVSVDELIDRLWDGEPPNPGRAKATLQMVVTRLRQALGEANCVRTVSGGYLVEVAPDQLDLLTFRTFVEQQQFAAALELWRGAALADVSSEALHRDEVPSLREERLVALQRRIDADLARGADGTLVPELRSLTREHPLRERFWGQLMLALYRSEQQAEAIAAFGEVRRLLADELGVDPGSWLTELYRRILRVDPTLLSYRKVPRQLPHHLRHFVGRKPELVALDQLHSTAPQGAIAVVHGTGGVGKTTLALCWAHRVRHEFPDGDLYLNLRGFEQDSEPMDPSAAAEALLLALDVRGEDVPTAPEARFGLLRTTLADRRMLLVLDNAVSSAQVSPLLPGAPGVTVLITSRNQLRGLAARYDTARIPLRQLDLGEAEALLSAVLGAGRVAAEPEAIRLIVERCGALPLALRVFAEKAARFPDAPLSLLADELEDERTRLDALSSHGGDGVDVRAVVSWSYRALDAGAARLFALLSVHTGPEFGVAAAAALGGIPDTEARDLLERLVADHLLQSQAPGRYHFHDLLRAYAAEVCGREDEEQTSAAERRLVEWYVHSVVGAAPLLTPAVAPDIGEPSPGVRPQRFPSRTAAIAWCRQEWDNLRVVVGRTIARGWHRLAWLVAESLYGYLDFAQALGREIIGMFESVQDFGSVVERATMSMRLAWAYGYFRRTDDAVACYERALVLVRECGDHRLEGAVAINLAGSYHRVGRTAQGLEQARIGLAIADELGNDFHRGAALNGIAIALLDLGQYEEAARREEECFETFGDLGDDAYRGRALLTLGRAHVALGRFDRAVEMHRLGLELVCSTGVLHNQALHLVSLGTALMCLDRLDEGRDCWERGAKILSDFDEPRERVVRKWLDDLDGGP